MELSHSCIQNTTQRRKSQLKRRKKSVGLCFCENEKTLCLCAFAVFLTVLRIVAMRSIIVYFIRSVFEGMISETCLKQLKKEIDSFIDARQDSVCIYQVGSLKYSAKEQIGLIKEHTQII